MTIETKIAALETALASGELVVQLDGKRIEYRSTEEILRAIAYFRTQVTTDRGATTLASYSSD